MSVPLDLSLINQLLNEQRTQGDLNNLTKSGFFYVLWPTNTPNDRKNSCHVINLVNYISNAHTAENINNLPFTYKNVFFNTAILFLYENFLVIASTISAS